MRKLIELIQRPKIPLRWKLLFSFVVANLALGVALAIGLFSLFGTTTALDKLNGSAERSAQVNRIELAQQRLVNYVLDYVWSGNLARLNDYQIASDELNRTYASFAPSAFEQTKYQSIKTDLDGLQTVLKQMIERDDANKEDEALTLWRTQGSKFSANFSQLIGEIDYLEERNALAEYQQATDQANTSAYWISALGVGALGLAVGLALLLTAALTGPILQLKNRLLKLAQGDLTQTISIVSRDELGTLGDTYNTTLSSLQHLVRQLYLQSQQVTSATEELASQAKSQVVGSSQQAGAIAEATRALQELSQTALAIASQAIETTSAVEHTLKQAQLVSGVAEEMAQAQQQGRANVARTIEALFKLKERVEAIEQRQQELVEQSAVIGQVIGTINSIAQETHLLALNSAIEAAGAGQYGERFSVIAGEVKRLADSAVRATNEVRKSLEGVAQAVERSSQSAALGVSEAEQAANEARYSDSTLVVISELSEKVKDAANSIVEYIEGTATLANSIGAATQQQQAASQQVLETMLSIETVTAQNLSSIRQGELVTHQLSLSARELERSADAFRLAA